MEIYVVQPGDSFYSVAQKFGVPLSLLLADNRPVDMNQLVVGQALVVRFPETLYTVRAGDTVAGIAGAAGLSVRQLYRYNPALEGRSLLWPGQTLVLSYRGPRGPEITVSGYAYPFINEALLRRTLPYVSYLTPFTFGIQNDGALVDLDDGALLSMARQAGSGSLMHLSTLTDEGNFSNELAHLVLTDPIVQARVIENVLEVLQTRGYSGLDVDFEFVFPEDGPAYAAFIQRLRDRLGPLGYPVVVALAPKTSADQRGLLYEGHRYAELGAAADAVLLMTYEWGYTYYHIRQYARPDTGPALHIALPSRQIPPNRLTNPQQLIQYPPLLYTQPRRGSINGGLLIAVSGKTYRLPHPVFLPLHTALGLVGG